MVADEAEALDGMVKDGDNTVTADGSSHSGEVDLSDDDIWASDADEDLYIILSRGFLEMIRGYSKFFAISDH